MEEDLKRNFIQQKTENTRLQHQITQIKNEKMTLDQNLLGTFDA